MEPGLVQLERTSRFAGLDRRVVTEGDLVAHSVAVMCPSVSALGLGFLLPAIVGPGAWLSVLIGFGVAYLLACAFGQFGSRLTATGSLYTYAAKGLGPWPALVVLVSLIFGYAVLVSFGLSAAARRAEAGWEMTTRTTPPSATEAIVVLAALIFCGWMITRGVRASTRFAFVAESLALVCLVLVLAVTAVRHGLPAWSDFSLAGAEPSAILAGAALIMTITVGFESSAALGVEASRPFGAVPRSMRTALLVTGALFLVSVMLNSGPSGQRGAGRTSWFSPGADAPVDGIILLVLAASLVTLSLCAWTALSRLLFAVAREGLLPAALGRSRPSTRAPSNAVWVVAPLALTPMAVTLATGHPIGWATGHLLSTATVILGVAYAIAAAAAIPFLARIDELRLATAAVAAGAAGGMALLCVVVVREDSLTGRGAVMATLSAVVGAGTLWWLRLRRHRPDLLARVGMHDEPLRSEVLLTPVTMGRGRG